MRKNIRGRKATAIALASVMAMSLAACGKQDGSNPGGQTEQKEYVYVPEYLELDDNTNSSYSNMTVQGDKLYYTNYQWDEASGESKVVLGAYSLTDGSREDLPITINADSGGIYSMQADEEGNIYTAEFEWNATEGDDAYTQQTTVLHKYDASGTELMAQDITDIMQQDENNSYVGSMCLDDQGRFYISSDSLIRLFGSDGQFQGAVQTDSQWIQGMGKAKDGKVYLAYYDQSGNVKLSQIDFDGKALGQTYDNFPNTNGNGGLCAGIDNDLLVNTDTALYDYSLADQKTTEILSWLDSDINGSYVTYAAATADGKILAVVNDWNTGETDLVKLTKTKASEVAQKSQITIGTLYTSQSLQAAAVAFNKQSNEYHVNIKTYIDDNNWNCTNYIRLSGKFDLYSDDFNLSDKKYENFDEVFLPLTPKVKFENSTIDLTSQNDLIEGCFFSSHKKNTDYIQGKTTYSAKDSKKINILSSLEKSFDNTFSIEGEVTKMGLAKKPDITVESQIFTLEEGNVVDSNFIKKETELNTSDKEKVVINIKDKGLQGYELNYDIFLVSKISAEITPRNVAVQKYYAPLLYYEEDFQKYCLQATFTDNTIDEITLESTLPALGMSAGGNDNQGTGGLTFVAGTANVSINTNVGPTSGEEVGLLINGFPDSVFSGAGLSGISRFPNNDMSRIIQDSKGYCGMVPVYLVNAGTSRIKYKNTVYKFQDSNDRDKEKSKKVEWFETENQNCGEFTSALLFLRIKDTDNFIPINHFFKLGYSDRTEEKAGIKRYYSLLSQIYAQRPFENKVEVYTVGNFSYVNKKVQYKRKLEATITYNDNSLKYNNKLMVEFFGKELPNCARIDYQSNGGQIIIKSSLDYTFNIDNKYVDEYLSYYNSESIPTYVAGNGTDSINAPINPTANALYYVSDKKYLEQITSSSPISLSIVDLELSSSQDYSTISVKVTSHSFGFSNLDMLIYDIRNDYACANNSKINYLLTLYWGCHEPNYRNPTQICDKSLDTNCSITKLKIEQ